MQAEIRRRGDDVAWFVAGCSASPLKPDERRLKTVRDVQAFGADATFVPGDWVPYFFPGIKVEVFHGMARNKRGHKSEDDSDHYRIRGWFDLYCTHAERDTEKFQALAREWGHFSVTKTGWPKLDPLLSNAQCGARALADGEPPTVFFASTFSRSVTCAPQLADKIEVLSKSGSWRFIVTLHPKMEEDVVERYRSMQSSNLKFVESDEDLIPLLSQADIMLCDTSSIMFEFMFLQRPVVTFRTKMPGPYLIDVQHVEQLESELERAFERPESLLAAQKQLCRDLHEFQDGRSSERVLDAVEEFLLEKKGTLKRKPRNLLRKIKVRLRLKKELAKKPNR